LSTSIPHPSAHATPSAPAEKLLHRPSAARPRTGERGVLLVYQPHEHARVAAQQLLGQYPSALQRLPARLQQKPLLRVNLLRLSRRDAKEARVEPVDVWQEAAPARHHLARRVRVWVIERVDIPPLARHLGDGVNALVQQTPERLRIRHPARKAASHTENGNGLVQGDL
jgi:hypothetical protein